MPQDNATLTFYDNPGAAEAAVARLRHAGFDLRKVSMAAREPDAEKRVFGCYGDELGPHYWGGLGSRWGAIWGALSGWALFCLPDLGPVLVAGPLSGWIVAGLRNASLFEGLSSFGAGLYSIGIRRERIPGCEASLRAGKCLVLVHGAASEVSSARQVLMTAVAD